MQKLNFINLNKKIYYYLWDDVEQIKGVIQISHGMCEYAERYDNIAKFFNKHGYVVVADDHRGHGHTDEDNLGYAHGDMADDTVKDMFELLKITKKMYPSKKYILFGFSYGSFLTQKFLEKYSNYLDGVVVAGSSKNSKLAVKFGKFITKMNLIFKRNQKKAHFVKKMTFDRYDKNFKDKCFLSNNQKSNQKYYSDKFCGFVCSYNFYYSFFKMLDSLYKKKNVKNINKNLSILIVSGKNDPVGQMGNGVKKLYNYYKKIGLKNIKLILYPNARHEFFNEIESEKKLLDIVNFCNNVNS